MIYLGFRGQREHIPTLILFGADLTGCQRHIAVRVSFYQSLPHIFWVYAPQLEVSRQAQDDCVNGLRWLLGLTE
ncbi:hypothetical protein HCH54_001411 [Aspergillus fumigatus]